MTGSVQEHTHALNIWVLVSDGRHAHLYVRDKRNRKPRKDLRNIEHSSTLRLVTTISMPSSGTAKRRANEAISAFAKSIAAVINKARSKQQFHRLVLIAPAALLKSLNRHLTRTVRLSIIAQEVNPAAPGN